MDKSLVVQDVLTLHAKHIVMVVVMAASNFEHKVDLELELGRTDVVGPLLVSYGRVLLVKGTSDEPKNDQS